MLNYDISPEELHQIISQLDQSLYNHQQWYNALIRTVICGLPPDARDLSSEAHKDCRFGHWYYNESPAILHDHPGFIALGEGHCQMHRIAAHLLECSEQGITISTFDYDDFSNVLERMRLEVRALKRELEGLLHDHDPLTHVINRVNMSPILRELQELSKRTGQPCCIVMMDLDRFKNINDLYGHQVGDKILAAAAHYIIHHLRPYDKVFRYGGEEFLMSFPNTALSAGLELVERLRKGVAEMSIEIGPNQIISITVSCGLALLDPNSSLEQSIERADKALYMAKADGRNCTRCCD